MTSLVPFKLCLIGYIRQRASLGTQTRTYTLLTSMPLSRIPRNFFYSWPRYSRIDISPEFSFNHMLEFSKLAVAFVIELGGWTNY